MKNKNIPTVAVLIIFSWVIAGLGVLGGGVQLLTGGWDIRSIIDAFLMVLGSMFAAVLIRVFGNIAQMIFDLKAQVLVANEHLGSLQKSMERSNAELDSLSRGVEQVGQTTDKVNCDTKDINNNINRINALFEQIGKHLDLNK